MSIGTPDSTADGPPPAWIAQEDGAIHVHPGDDIQSALDAAAAEPDIATVRVHTGTYRPRKPAQALIQFNAEHDGIVLEAVGEVVLTAANADVAQPNRDGFPAIVNHIVYFGDGISGETILRGFRLTGANGFVTQTHDGRPIEPRAVQSELQPQLFFYMDGGAVKIFGRSAPTLERLQIVDNATRLCGGGVSVEQRGLSTEAVMIRDCVFRDNRCPATGSAIDVLEGSRAHIENSLFVGNIANTGMDEIAATYGLTYNWQHGSGALTVFPESHVVVRRCTFTENWNGVDDKGVGSIYERCVFWGNNVDDGSRPGSPYEIDILDASGVRDCLFGGAETTDLRGTIEDIATRLVTENPDFNQDYEPRAAMYDGFGYRRPAEGTEATTDRGDNL